MSRTKQEILAALQAAGTDFQSAIYGKDVRQGLVDVEEAVYDAVDQWGALIDDTLTQSGQAADSKAVGDNFVTVVQNSLQPKSIAPYVVGTTLNLNDVVAQGNYIISSNTSEISTVSNAPAGFRPTSLTVMRYSTSTVDSFILQIAFKITQDDTTIYIRWKKSVSAQSPWIDWFSFNAQELKSKGLYPKDASIYVADSSLNLNDIIEPGLYLINTNWTLNNAPSVSPSFTPNVLSVAKYHTTYDTFIIQSVRRLGSTSSSDTTPIDQREYVRSKGSLSSPWTNWTESGTGSETIYNVTKNVTQNTFEGNTYNITAEPTITTDSHGWLAPSGSSDMASSIMTMLNATGYCHLGEGTFYVGGNIDIPENGTLCGCGAKTKIVLLSTANTYAVKLNNHSTLKDLWIDGGTYSISATPGNRIGIYYTKNGSSIADYRSPVIDNIIIKNFDNAGIYCYNTTGHRRSGLIASNIYIDNCHHGIFIDSNRTGSIASEFHKFNSCEVTYCYIACENNGGNNDFINCTFQGETAFLIDDSSGDKHNTAHGACIGCTFVHQGLEDEGFAGKNKGKHVEIYGSDTRRVAAGFIFSGCNFFYGSIIIDNANGIIFDGCTFGQANTYPDALYITNTKAFIMSNSTVTNYLAFSSTNIHDNVGFVLSNVYNRDTGAVVTLS